MNGVLPYWLAKRICNEWPRVHGAAFVPADLGPCDALILDPPPARGSMRVFDASPPPHLGSEKSPDLDRVDRLGRANLAPALVSDLCVVPDLLRTSYEPRHGSCRYGRSLCCR